MVFHLTLVSNYFHEYYFHEFLHVLHIILVFLPFRIPSELTGLLGESPFIENTILKFLLIIEQSVSLSFHRVRLPESVHVFEREDSLIS